MKWWFVPSGPSIMSHGPSEKLRRDFAPAVNNLHQSLILGHNADDQLERPFGIFHWNITDGPHCTLICPETTASNAAK